MSRERANITFFSRARPSARGDAALRMRIVTLLIHLLGAALGWLAILVAAMGVVYCCVAARVFRRFFARARAVAARTEAVTLLKPLYGAEPRLAENLATFLDQRHHGPVQMICGVQRADDPAIAAVRALQAAHPDADIELVIDATVHGASGKLSNLINMDRRARHPVVVLSDSDIAVAPDYLAQLLAALDRPGTGAATAIYRGRGDTGIWSRLGAAGVSYQFMLGLVFGVSQGLAAPCMGSTIALRRETLDRIGGFARFADVLADDFAIGEAVRATGQRVDVPPIVVVHAFDETSLTALWRHELRWGATVRDVKFWAYVGAVIGLPFPVALLAALYWPAAGLSLVPLALAARYLVVRSVDAALGTRVAPYWMAPAHDLLSFGIYVASFFVRSVDWRGATLKMHDQGRISAQAKRVSEQRA